MDEDSLTRVGVLLRERNAIDGEIAWLIQRPMTSGHLGEWIAAQVFDIQLETSAAAAGIDGRFRSGPLQDRTVNIKWYLKREGAGYHRVRGTRLLPGPHRAAVGGGILTREHPALVHPGRVLVRCTAAPNRPDQARSEAGRCLQRHQPAVGRRRNLSIGQQPPVAGNPAPGRTTQAIYSLTSSSPVCGR